MRRVLIANRGEIALRIARTCRTMGLETVAVYSEADVNAPHVVGADRAVCLGPAPPAKSYLAIDRIIDAARATGADTVHPGYGLLSENAEFAAACQDAGLLFVGPPASVIEQMGSKIAARRLMTSAGVPVVPGEASDDQSDDALAAAVQRLGLPVLVKPSEGGGGIGMREIRMSDQTLDAIRAARRDAVHAFGDGTLYLERLINRPRHIEVQIVADDHGQVAHLFERECSIQRRHQKVIEESPSPALTPIARERITAAAVAAARAAAYRNAGTVEFLYEDDGGDGHFYFLEMNTRLQVEHPVTEMVTGIDLVRTQLLVAAGQPLPWREGAPTARGHAIECRVYAEDPAQEFLPQAGPLLLYREPAGPGVRVDSGVREGWTVPVHYDPLIAKLVVSGESRTVATARAVAALQDFVVLGIRTNIPFLLRILQDPSFVAASIDTGFLDRALARLVVDAPGGDLALVAAAAVSEGSSEVAGRSGAPGTATDPWTTLTGWRG
jgi:acetyl-CoA carboxylase biotin carboxylase subunit